MENFGLWDSHGGAYTVDKYREFLASRTHLLCGNRLKYLPDAIWLAGKMIGWMANAGNVPSDEELEQRAETNKDAARKLLEGLEEELVVKEYAAQVKNYGGEERVKEMKRAFDRYLTGEEFDAEKWSKVRPLPFVFVGPALGVWG